MAAVKTVVRPTWRSVIAALRRLPERIEAAPFVTCLWLSLFMNALITMLHAGGLLRGLALILSHPLYFLFNALIILCFYAISLFFARRIFVLSLVSVVWLGLGVTNGVLLTLRSMPLEAIDFYIARTGLAILPAYLGVLPLILIILALVGAIALLVLLFFKCPRHRTDHTRSLLTFVCCLLCLALLCAAVIGLADADPGRYDDTRSAYDHYGFAYCFLRSLFDRGIDRPEDYSEERLRSLLASLADAPEVTPADTPNVIFLQLESFFDVTRIKDVTFSEDPIPNFRTLGAEGAAGRLSVPSIGSGTANTEFEVLTGLDLDFFGTGEYPYASILGDRCCETIAYSLSALGYGTHSMHNHTGTFYDRYRVYANLGFDTFTPAEHMQGLTYTDLGWEKDAVLRDYIEKALAATEGPDFVFAVSVQGHGKYPELPMVDEPAVTVTNSLSPERHNALQYYVEQLHEMDALVGALRNYVAALPEKTVLVLYGDHLPALELASEELYDGDCFASEYVIWANYPLELSAPDLEAYQLSALTLSLLGIRGGLVTEVHRAYYQTEEYSEMLRLVGYDALYGDGFAFGGASPYTTKPMTLGLDPIAITEVSESADGLFVTGTGFTEASVAFVDGRKRDTVYLSPTSLFIDGYALREGDSLTVVQVSTDWQKLSVSPAFVVKKE